MKNDPESQDRSKERTFYTYRFGSAEFDEARFELRIAGLPVDVERRALEVLGYLLRHAGEVVTKEELLREVWAGRVTVDKVLPNAINKLRRALGETNAERLYTQARVGYRIDGVIGRVAVGRQLASRLDLAAGGIVPGRENFLLQRQLGSNRGSEVWLAEHAKTREKRVYKFGTDGDRLRALKREATLYRVLQESLADRTHFVGVMDWNFEHSPFFLECEYGGENLHEWAQTQLSALDTEARVALFLQVADAVSAAHGVGVLHKDLKPANILIAPVGDGWLIRLTDFGSGSLMEPDRLEALGITRLGLTVTQSLTGDSSSGTPLYIAPEVFAGHAPTVQSDVFALGIILYQLLAGHMGRPMVSGWEADVADEMLREDIRLATDGNPERRLASVAEFASRLRNRDTRRAQVAREARMEERAQLARESLARDRARRPYVIALIGVLAAGVLGALTLYRAAVNARNAAQAELERATAINRFLNEDLVGRSNPLVTSKGGSATLKDLMLGARERVAKRFAGQPLTEAQIRYNLTMVFNMLELLPEAEGEARRTLEIYEKELGADSPDALKTRAMLARLLTRTSKLDEAKQQIETIERLTAGATDAFSQYLVSSTWSVYHMNQGDYATALPEYQKAIETLRETDPGNVAVRDSMRMDLVFAMTQMNRLKEAREEGQRIIDDQPADDNGLVAAFAKAAMARTWTLEGDFDKAEAQLREAQETIVRLLGPEHTRNLMVLSDLFDLAIKRADWKGAKDYADRVYEGFVKKLGDDHNFAFLTLINVGQAQYELGEFASARESLRKTYDKLLARMTAANPQVQYTAWLLVACELDGGSPESAGKLLDTLDAKTLEASAADGLWQWRLDALRGLLLDRRGDRAAARPLLEAAAKGLASASDKNGRVYANVTRALARKD